MLEGWRTTLGTEQKGALVERTIASRVQHLGPNPVVLKVLD